MRHTRVALIAAVLVSSTLCGAAVAKEGFFARWNPMRFFPDRPTQSAPAQTSPEQRLRSIRAKLEARGLSQESIDRQTAQRAEARASDRPEAMNSPLGQVRSGSQDHARDLPPTIKEFALNHDLVDARAGRLTENLQSAAERGGSATRTATRAANTVEGSGLIRIPDIIKRVDSQGIVREGLSQPSR